MFKKSKKNSEKLQHFCPFFKVLEGKFCRTYPEFESQEDISAYEFASFQENVNLKIKVCNDISNDKTSMRH